MTDPVQTLLGGMSISTFLAEYWQQKPLLVRQAFPNFDPIITPDELAGLACETDKSRIVLEKGGKTVWEVRHGPFTERSFTRLPKTHWTLLVNDTEQLIPELSRIIQPFRFIPDWRIDDLMISFAVDGGSVGPHIDQYDVFLIQGYGKRHWKISDQIMEEPALIPDIDLCILETFSAQHDWVLEPGDMLYLPPNIAHYGVALGECMTYSVGFRAPNQAEILEEWVQTILAQPSSQQRYRDHHRPPHNHSGEITTNDLQALRNLLTSAMSDTQHLNRWLGSYLSKPKGDDRYSDRLDKIEITTLPIQWPTPSNTIIAKSPGTRFNYFISDDFIQFFANGQDFDLALNQLDFAQRLIELLPEEPMDIAPYLTDSIKNKDKLPALATNSINNAQLVQALLAIDCLYQ